MQMQPYSFQYRPGEDGLYEAACWANGLYARAFFYPGGALAYVRVQGRKLRPGRKAQAIADFVAAHLQEAKPET